MFQPYFKKTHKIFIKTGGALLVFANGIWYNEPDDFVKKCEGCVVFSHYASHFYLFADSNILSSVAADGGWQRQIL